MPLRVSMVEVRLCSDTLVLGTGRVHPLVPFRKKFVFPVPWKLGMARHSLACSCPSVCPRCKFQTVLHVYIPDEIHALGLPSSKNTRGMNTTFSYSAKVFDSPFGEICTTPSRTVTSTCRVFSWQLNPPESRGIQLDLTPLFQFHRWRQCWRIFLIFVHETLPDISFSENQTRGSCLGCIHEGQSETLNKGKQRDRNTQASV